ncbi:MAG: transposase, partial [Myxococcales bacterium]|nr:transposase [Myxococcales bacterium]
FVDWYNNEHRHSAIGYVTPSQRHDGEGDEILAKRRCVYEQAKRQHPERWAGSTRSWQAPEVVYLNPDKHTLEMLRKW